ncbi:Auxin-responsive protein IAA3-like protein [Drosera capensis]
MYFRAQVVGWPPIRSYRKKNNNDDTNSKNNNSRDHHLQGSGGVLVKELLMVLEAMFGVRIGRCMEREGSGKG